MDGEKLVEAFFGFGGVGESKNWENGKIDGRLGRILHGGWRMCRNRRVSSNVLMREMAGFKGPPG